jgi:CheY-like chemotaxis protein
LFSATNDYFGMFFRRKKLPDAPVPPLVSLKSPQASEKISISANTGGPQKKILVVDDDPIILKTLSFTLQSKGYQVITAIDGSQAIGMMRDEEPDMMLVDVCIPPDVASGGCVPWDGFQITQWIQQMHGKIPTIVISGADQPDYEKRAKAVGAEAFFPKPIDNGLLLASISSALAKTQNLPAARTGLAS